MDLECLQPQLFKDFNQILKSDRMNHAYLFSGDFASFDFALYLAKSRFCENLQEGRPCGKCRECQLIEDNDFSDVFKKSDTKDLKTVVKGYIDAFNSSLKDKYITTKNKDGYRVVTIDLTGDNYKMISKDISNKLLNNKEFIKSYANMNDEEESEVKEDLKDIDDGEFNGIKVSLYTKGLTNETKKISLESEDTKVEVKLLDDNNYKVKITNGDLSIGLDLKYTVSYNTKVEIEEYKNAVDSEKLSEDVLSILTKFTSQDSYKKLNNDIKTLTGTSIDELLSSYMTNNETDND